MTRIKKAAITLISIIGIFSMPMSQLNAATYTFTPSNKEINGCRAKVNIFLNAAGEDVNAGDIEIRFDPSLTQVFDGDSSTAGIQIIEGNAFESYWGNIVDNEVGGILLAGGSYPSIHQTLQSDKLFASIEFDYFGPAQEITLFEIRFDNVGNTLDSNIADSVTGGELLSSVVNGKYLFTKDCRVPEPTETDVDVSDDYIPKPEEVMTDTFDITYYLLFFCCLLILWPLLLLALLKRKRDNEEEKVDKKKARSIKSVIENEKAKTNK